ncbi:MAG: FAD-binding oxidoreductase [Rubrobacter sp.]|nr:FAD-binding oxidoreductase [Rubrobacter sp.]
MAATGTNVHVGQIRSIVGDANAREATENDAIDGVAPHFVAEPESVEDLSRLMSFASGEGLAIAPRGAGTKLSIGNPPSELDLVVGTANLGGIIEYVPGDQVVRVEAGISLEDLQERLESEDQMLGLDPPEKRAGATVGGIVATNSSGPRRLRYGTVRDLIIGITVVLPDGTVAKAGSKVVKNVAGYDLSKLFTGSVGSAGVIAQANFRLHPLPEAARTLAVEPGGTREAGEAAQAVMHSQAEPSAMELHWSADGGTLTVLLEGIEAGVSAQSETVTELLSSFGEVRTLTSEEADALGPQEPPQVGGDEVVLKVSAYPAALSEVLDLVLGAAQRGGLWPRITGHAGSGVLFAGLSGGAEEALVGAVEEVRGAVLRGYPGGSVVVHEAPLAVKQRVEAWGPAGDKGPLIRRVKERFDPGGTMNPGRFIGGL